MNEEKPSLGASGIRWLWVSALLIVIDQLTKLWIINNMGPESENIRVLPVFEIVHATNPGIAWSWGANIPGARWVFSGLAVGVCIMLVFWLRSMVLSTHRLLAAGLTLILGGALGNVIDRLRFGHVVDFLSFFWGDAKFPAFNVADSAICVGAAFVLIDAVRDWRRQRQAKQKASLQASGGSQ